MYSKYSSKYLYVTMPNSMVTMPDCMVILPSDRVTLPDCQGQLYGYYRVPIK
jgi:hypothetical protein